MYGAAMPLDPPIRVAGNVIGLPFTLRTADGTAILTVSATGAVTLAAAASTLGFYGSAGATKPTGDSSTISTAEIWDALEALGLVTDTA